MLKKSICCAVILCIALFGIFTVGCNGEKPDDPIQSKKCEVVLETTVFYLQQGGKDFIAICNTFDEVNEVFLRNGYDSYDNDIVRQYMNEHSKNMSLVVCVFAKGNYRGQYRIEEIEVSDGKLTMHIKTPDSNFAGNAGNNVFLMAGVNKTFVAGVTDLSYVLS